MSVIAVERALILLRYIIQKPEGLSIREASRELGYSPATIQKLISTLMVQGFAVQDKQTERYHIGEEAIQLGLLALSRKEISQIAHPHIEMLSRKTGETVFLAIARSNYAIYIDKVVSDQPIRMDAPLGVNRPYNCTAVGKILLGDKSDEEIYRLDSGGFFLHSTDQSKTNIFELRTELVQIQTQGWARDNEEFIPGAACVSAPIYNHECRIIAALAVSGPAERINNKIEDLVTDIKVAASCISREMGCPSK